MYTTCYTYTCLQRAAQRMATTSPQKESVVQGSNMTESLVDMEDRMREEIRQLQERRAAAMMNEIIDLQRERDLAMGRVKTLKKTVEGLFYFLIFSL